MMWVRSAFWTGAPRAGQTEQFRHAIDREIAPALRALPGVRDVKALWPQRLEDAPPNIACQILVAFDSLDDVERMLASPERAAMRARVREIAATMFEGGLSHIDYEAISG